MDKSTAALLGAIAGLSAGTAQAAGITETPAPIARPASYRELLAPVPDASERLKADDAARASRRGTPELELADGYLQFQFGPPPGYVYGYPYGYAYPPRYYHHHHHHNYYRRDHHHHAYHHHHHRWND